MPAGTSSMSFWWPRLIEWRSVRHFLEVLDELNHLGIEFVSFRENIDTGEPLSRAMVVIVGAIAELERSLIVGRVKAGMHPARLEGRRIGRKKRFQPRRD
jgi:DNA invertase Pin-like site-specific DNA recombinase